MSVSSSRKSLLPAFLCWTLLFLPPLLARQDLRTAALLVASAAVLWPLTARRLLPWSVGALAAIGALDIVHVRYFGALSDEFLFSTALRTNSQEAREFAQTIPASTLLCVVLWLLACFAIGRYLCRALPRVRPFTPWSRRLMMGSACIWALFGVFIGVKKLDLQESTYALRPVYPMHIVRSAVNQLVMSRGIFYTPQLPPQAAHAPLADTVVVVLGESASATRWSLLGYANAPTNKPLEQRENLQVTRVLSHGLVTSAALPFLLTARSADDSISQQLPSFADLAEAAGYKVFVFTNSRFNNRYEDFYSQVLRRSADVYQKVGDGDFDQVLTPHLEAALADPAPRKLIVLHTYGSHPRITERYPQDYAQFDNAYDNSILYTSTLLARWMDVLDSRSAGTAMLLYTSDHGLVTPPCSDAYTTGSSLSSLQVPLLLWGNAQLRRSAPQLWSTAAAPKPQEVRLSNAEIARMATQTLGYRPALAPPLEALGHSWKTLQEMDACNLQAADGD